jgi:signal transduction histidine kinase
VGRLRDNALWVTLGVLTLLLVVLAALQYHWVGQLGRAESGRRKAHLERAASRFQTAFDRELGRSLMAFRLDPDDTGDRRPALVARLAEARHREGGSIVAGLLLLTRGADGTTRIERCGPDEGAFRESPWPAGLEALRRRFEEKDPQEGFFRPGQVLQEPPGLVFPLVEPIAPGDPPTSRGQRWGPFRVSGLVVVLLDSGEMTRRLWPALAEAHFGPLGESDFIVAVTRRADGSIVYASEASLDAASAGRGDTQRPLPGFEDRSPWRGDPEDRGEPREGPRRGGPAGAQREPPPKDSVAEPSPWVLTVRHRDGSLQQAVAYARRRNLALGLGILALLGTAGAVLAVTAQRARGLARQQLEFVAGVTHELNTPLAAIRAAGQNLSDGIVTEPMSVRRYGELIEKEGVRLSGLVAQVLDFAGIAAGTRAYAAEPVDPGALTDEVQGDLRFALEQGGIDFEKDVPADLPSVRGDATALRRVLTNLVANAAKFAAEGRWVAVRAAAGPGGRTVVFRVEDRGPGIPREERARVFEPFYRGRASQRNDAPGAGLGLSLVRHVVHAHGGRVAVEDRAGGGTAVVVELPAAGAAGRQA